MKRIVSLFLSTTVLSIMASAQSSSVTLPSGETTTTTSAGESRSSLSEIIGIKKFEENNEITDAKIKADAGSLSQFSMKFNLSYYGPILADVSEKDQPNPDASNGPHETSISGSLGGRYRIDKTSTISLGSGLKLIHPFHGMDRTDLNNPYVSYDMTKKISGIQMRNSFGASYVTIPNYTDVGEYGSLNYDLSLSYDIGASGWAASLDSSIGYYLYKRDYVASDKKASGGNVAVYPGFKYNVSDKLNINTSTSISFWNPRSLPNHTALLNTVVSQRLGVGYAYTRDIYVAPYLNFFPDRLSADRTTFNISTSFSVL